MCKGGKKTHLNNDVVFVHGSIVSFFSFFLLFSLSCFLVHAFVFFQRPTNQPMLLFSVGAVLVLAHVYTHLTNQSWAAWLAKMYILVILCSFALFTYQSSATTLTEYRNGTLFDKYATKPMGVKMHSLAASVASDLDAATFGARYHAADNLHAACTWIPESTQRIIPYIVVQMHPPTASSSSPSSKGDANAQCNGNGKP